MIFPSPNGKYYFHVISGNGEIVLSSQGYTRRADAKRGLLRQFPNIKWEYKEFTIRHA